MMFKNGSYGEGGGGSTFVGRGAYGSTSTKALYASSTSSSIWSTSGHDASALRTMSSAFVVPSASTGTRLQQSSRKCRMSSQ